MWKSKFECVEVGGILPALDGMLLPMERRVSDSGMELTVDDNLNDYNVLTIGPEDKKTASRLIRLGDDHGKFARGIHYWVDMNLPRYIWSELDTYMVGMSPTSSESTVYTLKTKIKELCKAYPNLSKSADYDITVQKIAKKFTEDRCEYKTRYSSAISLIECVLDGEDLDTIKANLPEGFLQRRIRCYSAQTLRRMYHQRHKHPLSIWKEVICPSIEKFPHFKEVILPEKDID